MNDFEKIRMVGIPPSLGNSTVHFICGTAICEDDMYAQTSMGIPFDLNVFGEFLLSEII